MSSEAGTSWLPDEYDPDASLRDRIRVIAEVEGGIELHVADPDGNKRVVGEPVELSEKARGVLELKAGGRHDDISDWTHEIVIPEEGDAFVRSADPDQDVEDYMDSRETVLTDIDVRIYGVDNDRLPDQEDDR